MTVDRDPLARRTKDGQLALAEPAFEDIDPENAAKVLGTTKLVDLRAMTADQVLKAATPQTDEIKLERAKLLAEVTARQALVQQANLINVRAQQTIDAVAERRRTLFADSILRRTDSLINPSFWVTVATGAMEIPVL